MKYLAPETPESRGSHWQVRKGWGLEKQLWCAKAMHWS